jgi:hypothetical protein
MVGVDELRMLVQQSNTRPGTSYQLLTMQHNGIPAPPPRLSLRRLYAVRQHDRALYRIQGSVSFVRKLSVTLRCTKCFKQAICNPPNSARFVCPQCTSRVSVAPYADCLIAFDDNTAEASVYIEGQAVYDMLYSARDRDGEGLRQLQRSLEAAAWTTSRFVYDHIDAFQQRIQHSQQLEEQLGKMMELSDPDSSHLPSNSCILQYTQLCSGKYLTQPAQAVCAYLDQMQYSRLLELWVKVDAYRSCCSSGQSAEPKCRMIRLQESNAQRRHVVQLCQRATYMYPRLDLVTCRLYEVYKQQLTESCHEILASLS